MRVLAADADRWRGGSSYYRPLPGRDSRMNAPRTHLARAVGRVQTPDVPPRSSVSQRRRGERHGIERRAAPWSARRLPRKPLAAATKAASAAAKAARASTEACLRAAFEALDADARLDGMYAPAQYEFQSGARRLR